jgi:hypothetical protein
MPSGKTESLKLIKNGYKVFMWSNLIDDMKRKYPESLKSIISIKDINDLYNFYKDKDDSLNYDQFNEIISQYFSSSVYDLIGI